MAGDYEFRRMEGPLVTIGGVDISKYCNDAEYMTETEEETTRMFQVGDCVDSPKPRRKFRVAGFHDKLNAVNKALEDLVGTPQAFVFRPESADDISEENPEYQGEIFVPGFKHWGAQAGEKEDFELPFTVIGTPTKLIAPPA